MGEKRQGTENEEHEREKREGRGDGGKLRQGGANRRITVEIWPPPRMALGCGKGKKGVLARKSDAHKQPPALLGAVEVKWGGNCWQSAVSLRTEKTT